jgi:Flp pilus assembly pilin Flp
VARLSARLHVHLDQISKEEGASAAEYALFLATIAAIIAAAVQGIGISLNSIFTSFVAAI